MVKIYTKTGDEGRTGLFSGERVSKDHPLVNTYGTVDELNSVLGITRALHTRDDRLGAILRLLQSELFNLGADLASGDPQPKRIAERHVARLEEYIDDLTPALPELRAFILPTGHPVAAQLHLARTVCRRAERLAVAAQPDAGFDYVLVRYLNRLADLLFVLAREANRVYAVAEEPWDKDV
jgi:cob(I)alamin adenosyltransferase